MENFTNNQSGNTSTLDGEIELNQNCEVQVKIGSSIYFFPAIINSKITDGQNNTQYAIQFVKEQAFNDFFLVKRDQIKLPEAEPIERKENPPMLTTLNTQIATNELELKSKENEKDLREKAQDIQIKIESDFSSIPKMSTSIRSIKASLKYQRRASITSNCSMFTNICKMHREKRKIKPRFEKDFNYYENKFSKNIRSNITEKEATKCWKVKDLIAVRDKNLFYKAKILEIKSNQIKIHFIGWNSRYDKWFHNQDENLKQIDDGLKLEEGPQKATKKKNK